MLNEKNFKMEAARCLLCHEPACNVCENGFLPSEFIRKIRFENSFGAAALLKSIQIEDFSTCEAACIHPDRPIRISELVNYIEYHYEKPEAFETVDLSIDFLHVKCENPFFLSSSIVASNYEMCAKALDMGWGGIVFKTIGILKPDEVSPRFNTLDKEGTPFLGFRNLEQISEHTLEENLNWLSGLKKAYPKKVIVASIMGQTDEEWTYLAKAVTEIGLDIIECNFSCPHMSGNNLGSDVGQNPELVEHLVECVRKGTNLPILAKMTPNISHMELPAIAAIQGGADGIAAINTIKSLTGIDLELRTATPTIAGKSAVSGYSGKAVKPIALRFIHDLAKYPQLQGAALSGMGGIETWRDALEFIALGCGNIQVTTAVMQYGYRMIDDLIEGTKIFMKSHGYQTISEMVGMALDGIVSPDNLDRTSIEYPMFDRTLCVGCGRCYLSCYDAGHQAIKWQSKEKKVVLDPQKCVGCHLCICVCPNGAISAAPRRKKA